jgi:hypothetical protein
MARNTAVENINHFAGIRFRVLGAGDLNLTIESLDDTYFKTLVPITMAAKTRIEPFRIANFTTQRARLVIKTTAFDNQMKISKIIVFTKPIYSQYPGI